MEAQKLLDGVLRDQKATINYQPDDRDPIPTIFDYIEQIRISLWDTAFFREFAVEKGVNKNNTIDKQYLFKPALHRVLYRYFKYVLFPSKAISRSPPFFVNFLERDSEDFMLTEGIMKSWDSVHWERCGWYLDCPASKAPSFDIVLRDSIQPPSLRTGTPSDTVDTPLEVLASQRPASKSKRQPRQKKAPVSDQVQRATSPVGTPPLFSAPDAALASSASRLPASPPSPSVLLAEPITKRQKVDVPESSTATTFLSPPKRHPMKVKVVALSTAYTSQQLLVNDSFVRIVEEKTITGKFSTNYEDIVYFLNKVFP